MNKRSTLLALLALGVAPLTAQAQQSTKLARIGFLGIGNPKTSGYVVDALKLRLRELGHIEGKNVAFEIRWAAANGELLPELAAELVNLKVDLLCTWASAATMAAKKATAAVPIVMFGIADPVGSKFVASLARPGGNITGVSNASRELSGKRLELLAQVGPRNGKYAALSNARNPSSPNQIKETEAAAHSLGMELQIFNILAIADIDTAFASLTNAQSVGLVVIPDPIFISQRRLIADLAIKYRMPTVFARRENVDAGGLLSYGPGLINQVHGAAGYVDKILRGTKPDDLPVMLPTNFELVINLKTAKALGITIPQVMLSRADQLIR